MNKEIWKDVVGYEGLYEVSNKGRVKGMEKSFYCGKGRVVHLNDKIMASKINKKSKYHSVSLCNTVSVKIISIHRLVAIAFIPNPLKKRCVNHLDGNPGNNNLYNLEWATHRENAHHAHDTGLVVKKKRKGTSSKYIGVSLKTVKQVNNVVDKFYPKWIAQIRKHRKGIYLGEYKTEEDAAKAYDKKAIELFGEKTTLNFKIK